jgi:hypothetical protein
MPSQNPYGKKTKPLMEGINSEFGKSPWSTMFEGKKEEPKPSPSPEAGKVELGKAKDFYKGYKRK